MKYSLKFMAQAGHVMGLATIGEVAHHMECHYDAYFLIENLNAELKEFEEMVSGHEADLITQHLTEAEIAEIDEDLNRVLEEGIK